MARSPRGAADTSGTASLLFSPAYTPSAAAAFVSFAARTPPPLPPSSTPLPRRSHAHPSAASPRDRIDTSLVTAIASAELRHRARPPSTPPPPSGSVPSPPTGTHVPEPPVEKPPTPPSVREEPATAEAQILDAAFTGELAAVQPRPSAVWQYARGPAGVADLSWMSTVRRPADGTREPSAAPSPSKRGHLPMAAVPTSKADHVVHMDDEDGASAALRQLRHAAALVARVLRKHGCG